MSSAPPGFWGAAAGRGGAWVSAAGVWSAVGAFVAYAVRRELCVGGVMSRATRRRLVMRACRQSAGPPSRLARRAARKGGLGEARMAVLSLAVRQGGKADSKLRCSTSGSPPRQGGSGPRVGSTRGLEPRPVEPIVAPLPCQKPGNARSGAVTAHSSFRNVAAYRLPSAAKGNASFQGALRRPLLSRAAQFSRMAANEIEPGD